MGSRVSRSTSRTSTTIPIVSVSSLALTTRPANRTSFRNFRKGQARAPL